MYEVVEIMSLLLQPQVITVVLKVHMHCEACAQEIKKRILRMKGNIYDFISIYFCLLGSHINPKMIFNDSIFLICTFSY